MPFWPRRGRATGSSSSAASRPPKATPSTSRSLAARFGFAGPFAIAIARGIDRQETVGTRLNILVPVTGTPISRQGAELAIALAQASQGSLTALHVAGGQRRRSWRRHVGAALAPATSAAAIIREIVRLGDPYGVEVKGAVRSVRTPQEAILRQIEVGGQ